MPIPSFQSDIIISMNMSAGIFFDGFYLPIQLSFIVPMIEKEGRGIFPLSVQEMPHMLSNLVHGGKIRAKETREKLGGVGMNCEEGVK